MLNHNKPEAYLLTAKAYEKLLDAVDDLVLLKIFEKRHSGKTIRVNIEDLSARVSCFSCKGWAKLDG